MKPMKVVIYSSDEGETLMCFKKDEEKLKKIWFQSTSKHHPGRQIEDYDRRVSSFGEGDVFFFHPYSCINSLYYHGSMGTCKISPKLP